MQAYSNGLSSQTDTSKDTWIEKPKIDCLTAECLQLYEKARAISDDKPIEVKLDSKQFNYKKDASIWVSKVDIKEFLCKEKLNVSLIQVFMRLLQNDHCGRNCIPEQFGWLCPSTIRADIRLTNGVEVEESIHQSVDKSISTKKNFILAPCVEGGHWSLLVICPKNNTVYQFDSLAQDPPRPLQLKSYINSSLKKVMGTSPQWKAMKCAQQPRGTICVATTC
ncbi:uncharacterized protein LOC125495784 [Beta vulgaris subsp. vulgaris]|uniref:uncharacterized protein LOC125495784 n=1 Tax=Beta vulgaris subsp. vulgaris TaxID=3555 RepID=UPI002547E17B|nr:uncharacterized protein LOC125495784 [Beta vulgaris subsp. vulgaris]